MTHRKVQSIRINGNIVIQVDGVTIVLYPQPSVEEVMKDGFNRRYVAENIAEELLKHPAPELELTEEELKLARRLLVDALSASRMAQVLRDLPIDKNTPLDQIKLPRGRIF